MVKRWTKSEVELARRIESGQWKDIFTSDVFSSKPLTRKDFEDFMKMLDRQPIVPEDPPWWTQALQWADRGLLWIKGYGWMPEHLWKDILKENQ